MRVITWNCNLKFKDKFELIDSYNPDICFKLFGEEKIQLLTNIQEEEKVEVFFNLSSREWNGKWFTSADAWKIEKNTENSQDLQIDNSEIPVFDNNHSEEDDLPF